ncbi:hypothetical protein GCM10007876_40730 [Litoribrevibacter albus]|uniref:Uncharacterized protein n=1 Tax=Litoribrevibacter albus TaxID=1473156 RepID=A0AA37SEG5_9GAMM|nr:hypothetical protein GCM10007876_40730 [Litoribrevibacter albus]
MENKTNSIVNLIDDRWLSDKSFLYEVVSERELIGYVYIGADGCKIYEIGLVNLNIDLITFKRLISNFTYNQS